jgi:hypothetical protein
LESGIALTCKDLLQDPECDLPEEFWPGSTLAGTPFGGPYSATDSGEEFSECYDPELVMRIKRKRIAAGNHISPNAARAFASTCSFRELLWGRKRL